MLILQQQRDVLDFHFPLLKTVLKKKKNGFYILLRKNIVNQCHMVNKIS